MIGAIVGDIAGSRFEFHNVKSKDFELLVSGEDVAANRKRDWEKRKRAYAEKMKAVTGRKWWQFLPCPGSRMPGALSAPGSAGCT